MNCIQGVVGAKSVFNFDGSDHALIVEWCLIQHSIVLGAMMRLKISLYLGISSGKATTPFGSLGIID